jgi:zona occludens toxin
MLIFHAGLPRSGKSYEAMVRHIIVALQNGREVFAYIEGINHARVAEAAELPIEEVERLLHQVTRDQVPTIYSLVKDNALVVLDEAQNFWPTGRQRLGPEITQFITEHGHRGLDILLMGQDMRDVHPLWRRRVSQHVVFNKLDAVGAEGRYNATVYKATSPEKFEKITSAIGKYDPKYFGTYASHVAEDTNKSNYKDERANVRNAWWFKWGVPLAIGFAAWGGYTAWSFFHPTFAKPAAVAGPVGGVPVGALVPQKPSAPASQAAVKKDFVSTLNDKYRPRLAFLWTRERTQEGTVEWYEGDRVRERLSFKQLDALGAVVVVRDTVAWVNGTVATPWPVERTGQLPTVGAQVIPISTLPGMGGT